MSGRMLSEVVRRQLQMYLVLGSVNCLAEPGWVVQEALAGGATMVQFREKYHGALTGIPMFELARQLQELCRHAGVPFIINDDVELALEIDADGVHIGQDDESAETVRERIGNRILGVSAHTIEEARRAILQGADYLGVGKSIPPSRRMMPMLYMGKQFYMRCVKRELMCQLLGSEVLQSTVLRKSHVQVQMV